MKVYVLHECENQGCCEESGDCFVSTIYGVFPTEKRAKEFQKGQRNLRNAEITETELNPQPLKTKTKERT
jgi:hypothetical protein